MSFFTGFGALGLTVALFVIIMIDAALFPALPEFFAVMIFLANPLGMGLFGWGLLILVIACLGEFAGVGVLYLFVKKVRVPRFLENVMKKYIDMMLVRNERIILVNRVIPVVPFLGAFIAVCDWNLARSMLYIETGALVKYAFLLAIVGIFSINYPRDLVSTVSIIAIILFVGISFIISYIIKKRGPGARSEKAQP